MERDTSKMPRMTGNRRPSLDALNEKRTGQITNHADVLSYFDAVSPLTISEVAELAALSVSTVRRYVRDLVDAGYLVNGATTHGHPAYSLTPERTED